MNEAFLLGLPDPAVIEELSFETILSAMKADLVSRFPEIEPILALESSAAVKVMEVSAYRELVLRARINDAARANLLRYATGTDLDHVGANASPPVARALAEDDERFRLRILLSSMARNTGSEHRYRLVALNASTEVRDAIAYRLGRDPTVNVAVLSTASDGVAGAPLLATVSAALSMPENRMVNGPIYVRSAVAAVMNITAALTVTPSTPSTVLAKAETALRDAWLAEGGLGRDLTLDWVRSRLMVPGVYAVAISAPGSSTIVSPYEAASIGTVTLTVAGENA